MSHQLMSKTPTLPAALSQLASSQQGILTTENATAVVSSNTLANIVRSGQLLRLWRGIFVVPGWTDTTEARLRAAELTLGRPVVACLHSAAALHGFDIAGDGAVHVLAPEPWGSRRSGLVLHRRLVTSPLVEVGGRLVTDPRETALCIAALQKQPPRVLAVLDAALRSGTVADAQALVDFADRLSVNRIRKVRPIAPWADGRAESPPESWLRWAILDAGLPPPVPQVTVLTAAGRVRRLDLGWPEYRVGCEFDGVEFHTGEALHRDRVRMNDLTGTDWRSLYITNRMIWHERVPMLARIEALLRSRGWRPGMNTVGPQTAGS